MVNSILAPSFLPDTVVLEITSECNHSCLFCSCPWYSKDATIEHDLSTDEWKEIIYDFSQQGVFRFSFSGGECTLRDDIYELLDFTSKLSIKKVCSKDNDLFLGNTNPDIVVLSNGNNCSESFLSFLKRINAHLSVSLPGLSTFPKLTGIGDSPETVLEVFENAAKIGLQTTAAITVTKINYFELYETIAAALAAGAGTILLNRYLPGGRGLLHPELDLSFEQVKTIPIIAEDVLRKANRFGHVGTEYPRCIANPDSFTNLRVGTRCAAATGFFVIGPDGFIRVCNYSAKRLCNWRNWKSLIDNEYWRGYVFRHNRPIECKGCSQYSLCDGGCRECAYVFSDNLCGRDPVFKTKPIFV